MIYFDVGTTLEYVTTSKQYTNKEYHYETFN